MKPEMKQFKRLAVVLMTLVLMIAGVSAVRITTDAAAKKPGIASAAVVHMNGTKVLSIEKNGYKIRKVVSVKSSKNAIARATATKSKVTVYGINNGEAKITVKIKATKGKTTKNYNLTTKATVNAPGFSLSAGSIKVGGEAAVNKTNLDSKATVQYTASNSFVEIDNKGKITGSKPGGSSVINAKVTFPKTKYAKKKTVTYTVGTIKVAKYGEKTVKVFREKLTNETAKVRYFSNTPSIPYMCIEDYYAVMLPGYNMTVTAAGNGKYNLINPCGKAVVDVNAETFQSDNYAAFTNLMWQVQADMDNIYLDGYPFVKVLGADYSKDPDPVTFNFGKYDIDLKVTGNRASGYHIYFPLSTLSDMFSNMDYIYSSYNGKYLYVNMDNDMDMVQDRDKHYYDPILSEDSRDPEMADFNYRELCFVFDNLYGYPGEENYGQEDEDLVPGQVLCKDVNLQKVGLDQALDDFGDIGRKTKKLIKSTDWVDYIMGMNRLGYLVFDGGHSVMGLLSYTDVYSNPARKELADRLTADGVYDEYVSDMTDLINDRELSNYAISFGIRDVRKAAIGDGRYFTNGDTAMYSMNGFLADKAPWAEYYSRIAKGETVSFEEYTEKEPALMGLIAAMDRAQADPDIKNFVIDLSANGGGSADVLIALIGLVTGEREYDLTFQNVLQGQDITQHFAIDRNFDGVFDERDSQVRKYNLNFAVLESQVSYSCGNLFPSMMKDRGYMVMGERSGGGACTILGLNTAEGFYYHISSYQMRLTNAAGKIIDRGVKPDAELSNPGAADMYERYKDFYDMDQMSELINKFYK